MPPLLRFSATIDWLNQRISDLLIWLILFCTLISALNATLRYTINWASNGLLEAQWFMFGLVFLLCAPWTLKEHGHVRIDILSSRFSPRIRILVDIFGTLFFLLPVCLLIAHDSWNYFLIAYAQGEGSPNPGGLIWWPIKLAIPLGFTLLALQGLSEIIKDIGILTGHLPMPEFHTGGH